MDKINSYEVSVSGAVDVAREVQRRDLVTEETGETITHETEELEDRLERLKAELEDKKKRFIVINTEKIIFIDFLKVSHLFVGRNP